MSFDDTVVTSGSNDLSSVKALLETYHLPVEDIDSSEISFYVIKDGQSIKACAGVERFGELGLLRSVAVKEQHKGKGVGTAFMNKVLEQSKVEGISTLYLLTETAAPFFNKIGFIKIDRSKAPGSIKRSNEFADLCPVSAVLMKKVL